MSDERLLLLAGFWILCAIACAVLAPSKGISVPIAFIGGLLLGPVGILAILAQRKAEPVSFAAQRCGATDSFGQRCVLSAGHAEGHRA